MVTYYSLDIFRRANVQMDNHILSILVYSGFTIGFIGSAFILSHIKRKIHFICAAAFMAISLATLGLTLKSSVSNYTLIIYDCFLHIIYFPTHRSQNKDYGLKLM